MDFCPDCSNILLEKQMENKIQRYCRICNFKDDVKNNFLRYSFKDWGEKKCEDYPIESYENLCHDKTIPIALDVKCKNKDCKDDNVIYIRCGETMTNIYICCKCKQYWYSN